ncbi:NepR family anti-sigma factor [Phaeovulum sp. W22_SRMD_FR3]|uniref:NepR family anti-sigma factor n=1 Tax=Phaeovulum sp. W22_SRMD_FR3 TaxID=3240274 RepID=UPI003F964916
MTNKRDNRKQTAIEQQIDENLRLVYQEQAKEEVPAKFLDLLQQLRAQEPKA